MMKKKQKKRPRTDLAEQQAPTVDRAAREIALAFLKDVRHDFHLPQMAMQSAFDGLRQNMTDGRQDALHILDTFKTTATFRVSQRFHLEGIALQDKSIWEDGEKVFCEVGWQLRPYNHESIKWEIIMETDNFTISHQDILDDPEYEGYAFASFCNLLHFFVDTDVPYDIAIHKEEDDEALVARFGGPEGVWESWFRTVPETLRQVKRLRLCQICEKRIQTNPRCHQCIMRPPKKTKKTKKTKKVKMVK